jgi:VWFA-related protein
VATLDVTAPPLYLLPVGLSAGREAKGTRVVLGKHRWIGAAVVMSVALPLGHGLLLPGPLKPRRSPPAAAASDPQRSGDDAGFSIVLAAPRDPYLRGRQKIAIDTTVPAGDNVQQVDFFVDGRLANVDLRHPYACEVDFGDEIKRHTIVASALTRQGRRAKVSYTSRSADLDESAARPIEVVPVLVRDARKHPVQNLSVSDFVLLEDGVRQPIVHFDSQPGPLAITVVVDARDPDPAARVALLRGAAALADELPAYHALALADTGQPVAPLEFTFGREAFARRIGSLAVRETASAPARMDEVLAASIRSLASRRGCRILVALLSGAPDPAAAGAMPEGGLAAALDALKRARVTFYAIRFGAGGEAGALDDSLRTATSESGGEYFESASPEDVEASCRAAGLDLAHRYMIGYQPLNPERPGRRALQISVRQPALEILARKVYGAD